MDCCPAGGGNDTPAELKTYAFTFWGDGYVSCAFRIYHYELISDNVPLINQAWINGVRENKIAIFTAARLVVKAENRDQAVIAANRLLLPLLIQIVERPLERFFRFIPCADVIEALLENENE